MRTAHQEHLIDFVEIIDFRRQGIAAEAAFALRGLMG
jgi:hypothetical protein